MSDNIIEFKREEELPPLIVCGECNCRLWTVDTKFVFTCLNCETEYTFDDMCDTD